LRCRRASATLAATSRRRTWRGSRCPRWTR
jgi:hypothetical protein